MENAARTAAHLARLEQRRLALRAVLGGILPPRAQIVWEVGCGHGHFLTAYAQAHPGQLCLGIDVIRERIDRAIRKRDRAQLANLHFLRAEAGMFLDELPADTRLAAIYVLFPDPWPKLRHHKHRLLQPGMLNTMAAQAGEGARLYFRTDHKPYFNQVDDILQTHTRWRRLDEPWPFEVPTVFQARAPSYESLVAVKQ